MQTLKTVFLGIYKTLDTLVEFLSRSAEALIEFWFITIIIIFLVIVSLLGVLP